MSMDKATDLEAQYDKIYRYCYFKIHNREMAEDITQETFLRFLESGHYQNTGRALQYLYTVARNLCIDEYRKKHCESLSGELTELEIGSRAGTAGSMEDKLLTSITVKAALEELEEADRELVLLRYVNEVPIGIVGRLFGMSRFAVYRRTKNILKILQEKLGKENFG